MSKKNKKDEETGKESGAETDLDTLQTDGNDCEPSVLAKALAGPFDIVTVEDDEKETRAQAKENSIKNICDGRENKQAETVERKNAKKINSQEASDAEIIILLNEDGTNERVHNSQTESHYCEPGTNGNDESSASLKVSTGSSKEAEKPEEAKGSINIEAGTSRNSENEDMGNNSEGQVSTTDSSLHPHVACDS